MQRFFAPFWWKRFLTIFSICCVKYCILGMCVIIWLKKREIQMCITSCPNIFATRWLFVNLSCRVSKLSLKIWTKKFFTVNLEFPVFERQTTRFRINILIKSVEKIKILICFSTQTHLFLKMAMIVDSLLIWEMGFVMQVFFSSFFFLRKARTPNEDY